MFNKIKKAIAGIAAVAILAAPVSAFANDATILIDGVEAQIPDGMGKVVITQDRTFVPIRFVLEYFNYAVDWMEEEQSIMCIDNANNMFMMQIGTSAFMFKPSTELVAYKYEMDVAPFLNEEEDRSYVPIRFLAERMGYEVGYDTETSTVTLNKIAE